jgi:hypothetical protein
MDLKIYYQKVREKRASIAEAFPVVVSQETGDGGKDGVLTEVTPDLAAKMIVDGTAHLASAEEAAAFRKRQAEAKKAAEDARAASQVQVTLMPKEMLEHFRKKG